MREVGVSSTGDALGEDLFVEERKEEVWVQSEFLINPTAAAIGVPDLGSGLTSTAEQSSRLVYGLRSKSKISKSTRNHPHKKADPNNINPRRTIIMLHLYGAMLLRKKYIFIDIIWGCYFYN